MEYWGASHTGHLSNVLGINRFHIVFWKWKWSTYRRLNSSNQRKNDGLKLQLIFVKLSKNSWLLEWCHWPANQRDAVWRRHILTPGQIVLNPVRAGTILIPGIGYNDLMENPETLGEPWWAFTHTERKNREILHLFWTGSCTGDVEAVQLTSIIILIS